MSRSVYRTIVYVDGFNFYYGEVRGTPWKWLDPVALFRKVLRPQNELLKVKYFTARVQSSTKDPNVNVRQDAYLRALQAYCPPVELYYGHFTMGTSSDTRFRCSTSTRHHVQLKCGRMKRKVRT